MGEISLRCRHRKDLAASFHRMKRMVSDIKSARKSLAAHHSFMAELVSVSLFPGVPSAKASSPQRSPCDAQRADLQEVGNNPRSLQSPPCLMKSARPNSRIPSCNLQLDDLQAVGSRSVDLQEAGVTSSTLRRTIPCSGLLIVNSILSSLKSLAMRVSASLAPSLWARRVHASPTSTSQLSCNILEEGDPTNNRLVVPSCPSVSSNSRKLAVRDVFGALLLLVFLCFFLCIGKEIAVAVTITAYCIIWSAFKGCSLLKQGWQYVFSYPSTESCVHGEHSGYPDRSLSISAHGSANVLPLSASHLYTRSRSLPILHGCGGAGTFTSGSGLSIESAPAVTSLSSVGTQSVTLKLGLTLVLVLCGLAHGQVMAVCMCSFWILIFSWMRKFSQKRFKKEKA